MAIEIETLARFAAHTQWEDIPPSVQRHAKLVLLDTLGVRSILVPALAFELGERIEVLKAEIARLRAAGIDLKGRLVINRCRDSDLEMIKYALDQLSMHPVLGAQSARGCGEITGTFDVMVEEFDVAKNYKSFHCFLLKKG